MKPDVIVSWPIHADYPLWRKFIRDERERFDRVFVVFTQHDGRDLSPWVRANLPDVEFPPTFVDIDWRNGAVNAALQHSSAEWVWFTEQDFFIRQPEPFWELVDFGEKWLGAIGFREPVSLRLHPACLFVRRDVIDRTRRYFGPDPVDHFYAFGEEVISIAQPRILYLKQVLFEHLQGTSQNHWLIDNGEDVGVFRRGRFRMYLWDCLAAGVPLEPGWREVAEREVRA